MAKPIIIIGLYSEDSKLAKEVEVKLYKKLEGEYHVICYWNTDIEEPKFQVFYEKDHLPIDIEELKLLIRNEIPKSVK